MKNAKNQFAWTAKVGEKGQIVIPKEARELFNIHPGDTLLLLGDKKRGIAIVDSALFPPLYNRILDEMEAGAHDGDPGDRADKTV